MLFRSFNNQSHIRERTDMDDELGINFDAAVSEVVSQQDIYNDQMDDFEELEFFGYND